MAKVNKIAFINGKGGCGKTTSIFHVAGVLAKAGEKVLVIDLDKQRNTSDLLLKNTDMPPNTVLDFMKGTANAWAATGKALFQTRGNAKPKYYSVDCMVADIKLKDELKLQDINGKKAGEQLDEFINLCSYTWVLIDMPPSNETLNKICFSFFVDFVIIPFSSDMFSLDGYGDIISTIDENRKYNPNLKVLGLYLARYMNNCAVDKYVKDSLEDTIKDKFINVQIPLSADIREAIMFGRPISYYKEFSNSRRAYEMLVNEMKKRIKLSR
jgi:chromosome partitioning protein